MSAAEASRRCAIAAPITSHNSAPFVASGSMGTGGTSHRRPHSACRCDPTAASGVGHRIAPRPTHRVPGSGGQLTLVPSGTTNSIAPRNGTSSTAPSRTPSARARATVSAPTACVTRATSQAVPTGTSAA
ncbi:hypothetical protein [Streptomyces carpaticus]|uniref:Uncharacterized protein n=1 Tax=Streptomyces carpaticus TaxID=285558 RepID=A0ABV4ZJF9_9ACTN